MKLYKLFYSKQKLFEYIIFEHITPHYIDKLVFVYLYVILRILIKINISLY